MGEVDRNSHLSQLIESKGQLDPDVVWSSLLSYDDLIYANTAFLHGLVARTPYHLGPIDNETNCLVDDLLDLHTLGIMTTNGQPGKPASFVSKWVYNTWSGSMYLDCEQKPWLEAIFPMSLYGRLLNSFIAFDNEHPDQLKYKMTEYKPSTTHTSHSFFHCCCCCTVDPPRRDTNMTDVNVITRYRTYASLALADRAMWENSTYVHADWTTKIEVIENLIRFPNIKRILHNNGVGVMRLSGTHFGSELQLEKLVSQIVQTH